MSRRSSLQAAHIPYRCASSPSHSLLSHHTDRNLVFATTPARRHATPVIFLLLFATYRTSPLDARSTRDATTPIPRPQKNDTLKYFLSATNPPIITSDDNPRIVPQRHHTSRQIQSSTNMSSSSTGISSTSDWTNGYLVRGWFCPGTWSGRG